MQEEFLHHVWQYRKFNVSDLQTKDGEPVIVLSVGDHNKNSGPDFFNAKIQIGEQLWAGNVEIHVNSSDWFLHGHETDPRYDNVILHVVWEHDTDIYRANNEVIPTLELAAYVSTPVLENYQKLFSKSQRWINCEQDFKSIDNFTLDHWLERLYVERLENKCNQIKQLLQTSKNDWEAVLFKMLAKNFGLKVNGDAFLSMANSLDFSIIRKLQNNQKAMEALLFGQAGLLQADVQEPYFLGLKQEYTYLSHKFNLSNQGVVPVQFFRLRPPNFPTIRLSQLSRLYHHHQNLFSKIIELQTKEAFYDLFAIESSLFWETHFTFGKVSRASKKVITKAFIDLLLINTIIPIKFAYDVHLGRTNHEKTLKLVGEIASEKNSIVDKFNSLKQVATTALQSQALLQLKNEYCDKNKCLQCAVGSEILKGNH